MAKKKQEPQHDKDGFLKLIRRDRYEHNPHYQELQRQLDNAMWKNDDWVPPFVIVGQAKKAYDAGLIGLAEFRDLTNRANTFL